MTTTISDLPRDLVWEIFSRVPLTSLNAVRYTCKNWNGLSKNQILGKAAKRSTKQFMGFMRTGYEVCCITFDLQRIRKGDFVDPCIKQISILNQFEVSDIIHCDGLLLCVLEDYFMLVVLNPYLGQIRMVELSQDCNKFDSYVFGYDNNHNHKILKIVDDYDVSPLLSRFEIYDLNSNSWKVLDINPDWDISFLQSKVTLNGNSYVYAQKYHSEPDAHFLLCFDFTTERFGPRLYLPFRSNSREVVRVSCVGDEKLAVLFQHLETIKIWITTKIEPDAVLWSMFLNVDISPRNGFPVYFESNSFFIEEETEVAVVSEKGLCKGTGTTAYIGRQDGYLKSVKNGETPNHKKSRRIGYPPVFSSYVPSLVQLDKRKEGDY